MQTYIDESGIFIDPQCKNIHSPSVIGSLTIPDAAYNAVEQDYIALKKSWGVSGEIKGSQLSEDQVNAIAKMLQKHDVLFTAVIVDAKMHDPHIIGNHKLNFANHIRENISPHHHENVVKQLKKLSSSIEHTKDQLYVQNIALTALIIRTHQLSTFYYVQRTPKELAQFKWIIDAKNNNLTKSEEWWKQALKPWIQGIALKNPMKLLEGADYSYYDTFNAPDNPEAGSVNNILKNLSFRDSASEIGIQLVDNLTTSLRGALKNTLQRSGWREIAKLMIHEHGQNLSGVSLNEDISTLNEI